MIDKRRVYLRADADKTIGFGHFTRSLALADMLKDEFDCTFFTQTPTDYQRREVGKVCKLVELPADDTKFSLFLDVLQGDEIVFLDNYFFSSQYQQLIKKVKGCKLVCMGGNDRHYYSDVLINYTDLKPDDFSIESYTKLCSGIDWALLRRPFWNRDECFENRPVPERINRIAVCFGGTDPFSVTEAVVEHLQKNLLDAEIHLIVTDSFGRERIEDLSKGGVIVHTNASACEIVAVFNSADVAVLSTSSIALEALALQTPVIAGYYIDNQKRMYETLNGGNYIFGTGDLLAPSANERIEACVKQLPVGQVNKNIFNISGIKDKYADLFKSL